MALIEPQRGPIMLSLLDVFSLCPRESTALLAAPESCRGLRCPASLFLAKSIIAAPPMAQKDLQVSKNARSLSILTSLGALNCRWTAL